MVTGHACQQRDHDTALVVIPARVQAQTDGVCVCHVCVVTVLPARRRLREDLGLFSRRRWFPCAYHKHNEPGVVYVIIYHNIVYGNRVCMCVWVNRSWLPVYVWAVDVHVLWRTLQVRTACTGARIPRQPVERFDGDSESAVWKTMHHNLQASGFVYIIFC